jgi:gamma-glutamyltranspeptidase/glutathione hydrolase
MYSTGPRMRGIREACVRALVLLLAMVPVAFGAIPEEVHARNGMVASRSAIASAVGAEILRDGGNAIDAAVATGFALAVTYPSAGNIGGGGFMVIRLADGTLVANDHREKAPAAASRDMYLDADGNVVPGLSIDSHVAAGVPGTVAGLLDALERYGTMSRKRVLAPAITLARNGFDLDFDLARNIAGEKERFAKHPASARSFLKKDGSTYAEGERLVQKDLARTLERISAQGRDGFYAGPTAALIAAEMERGGGLISLADLAAYRSVWREPIRGTYRGYEIVSMPPPSSGGVLLVQMLNMLEAFDVGAMGFGSADAIHLMIEASRRAYADRAQHLGDADFYPVPVAQLIDKAYARQRFADFDPRRATPSADVGAGTIPAEPPNTTHLSVMDRAGNAVALTTTLNFPYGSKIVVDGAGFLLNNEMDDFSAKDDTPNRRGLLGRSANAIEPGKRMLSSMAPTIVLRDGKPFLVTGSPGGSTIITTVLQVLVNVIDHGMGLSEAVGMPRFHHQWQPERVLFERHGISPDTLAILRAKGHEMIMGMPFGRGIGDANSVMWRDGEFLGMSDPRNAGRAVGF